MVQGRVEGIFIPQLQIPALEPADALLNLERSVSPIVLDHARKLLEMLYTD
jgi:hypothetical protein